MSLTKASFAMIEGSAINVGDFGAVGDGIHDDTAAIQAAIDSVPVVTNAVLWLEPNKTYKTTATISSNSRFLEIYGNKSSIVLYANADYVLSIVDGQSVIRDLVISKNTGVVANGIFVGKNQNRFDNVSLSASAWPKAIHLQNCKESHFSRIRVDNDVSSRTGTIFYSDYSVNNTITESFIGFCEYAFYFSGANEPTYGYRSEGFMITDVITVYAKTAVRIVGGTSINVSNCVLDFCINYGVQFDNGNTGFISNNWIANEASSSSFAAVTAGVGFKYINVTNNVMVNNAGSPNYAIVSNATYVKFTGNHIYNLDGGTINSSTSYALGNTQEGSGSALNGGANLLPIDGFSFTVGPSFSIGDSALPGLWNRNTIKEFVDHKNGAATTGEAVNLLYSQYGDVPTMGNLYVTENGTNNYFIGVYYKRGSSYVPTITLLANSGLTVDTVNANGSLKMLGFSDPLNLRYTITMMATTYL